MSTNHDERTLEAANWGGWHVKDHDGNTWWPDAALARHLLNAPDPPTEILHYCREYPWCGDWYPPEERAE